MSSDAVNPPLPDVAVADPDVAVEDACPLIPNVSADECPDRVDGLCTYTFDTLESLNSDCGDICRLVGLSCESVWQPLTGEERCQPITEQDCSTDFGILTRDLDRPNFMLICGCAEPL